jgi:hypothetical protein
VRSKDQIPSCEKTELPAICFVLSYRGSHADHPTLTVWMFKNRISSLIQLFLCVSHMAVPSHPQEIRKLFSGSLRRPLALAPVCNYRSALLSLLFASPVLSVSQVDMLGHLHLTCFLISLCFQALPWPHISFCIRI